MAKHKLETTLLSYQAIPRGGTHSLTGRTTYYNGISPDPPELLYRSDLLQNRFPIPKGRHDSCDYIEFCADCGRTSLCDDCFEEGWSWFAGLNVLDKVVFSGFVENVWKARDVWTAAG